MEHQLLGQGQDRIASLWSCYQLCNWVLPREATFKKCHQLNENVLSTRRFDVEEPRKRQSCNAAISSRNNRINRSADSKPFFQTLKKGVRTIANRMWKLRNLMNGDEKRRKCAEWRKRAPLHIGVSSGVEPKRAIMTVPKCMYTHVCDSWTRQDSEVSLAGMCYKACRCVGSNCNLPRLAAKRTESTDQQIANPCFRLWNKGSGLLWTRCEN